MFSSASRRSRQESFRPGHEDLPVRTSTADNSARAPGHRDSLTSLFRSVAENGRGQSLPAPIQQMAATHFGYTFQDIRVFQDGAAEAMGATAITSGKDLHFARGAFHPDTAPGQKVIAHELAHVVQQATGRAPLLTDPTLNAPALAVLEREADHASEGFGHTASRKPAPLVPEWSQLTPSPFRAGRTLGSASRPPASLPSTPRELPVPQAWGGSDHFAIGQVASQRAAQELEYLACTETFSREQENGEPGIPPAALRDWEGTRALGVNMVASPFQYTPRADGEIHFEVGGTDLGVDNGTGTHLRFASMNRLGGDYTSHPQQLLHRAGQDWHNELTMVSKAITNIHHFYPLAGSVYFYHHDMALKAARGAYLTDNPSRRKDLFRGALLEEGFACHFLQDSFAAGHQAPRCLDRVASDPVPSLDPNIVGLAINNYPLASEGVSGYSRTKPWHDLFCMLPDGLPIETERGVASFHGDYYMDGIDLDRLADVTSRSLVQVLETGLTGQSNQRTPQTGRPALSKIHRDPVAGPLWREMTREYDGDKDGLKRLNKVRLDDGVEVSTDQILGSLDARVFAGGAPATSSLDNLEKIQKAIEHLRKAGFTHNVHTGQDDQLNTVGGEQRAHEGIQVKLRILIKERDRISLELAQRAAAGASR